MAKPDQTNTSGIDKVAPVKNQAVAFNTLAIGKLRYEALPMADDKNTI